jgi:hypothetical protein
MINIYCYLNNKQLLFISNNKQLLLKLIVIKITQL